MKKRDIFTNSISMNHNETTGGVQVSVVLPCRNEAAAIGTCIDQINAVFAMHQIDGEIIVADSSNDGSASIARGKGAKVIEHTRDGYGAACKIGCEAATGEYIILMDADTSYAASDIVPILESLRRGAEFVLGNRFAGIIKKDAMPWLHRYIGRYLFSGLFVLLFHKKINDVHCGMRGLRRTIAEQLSLQTTGMEYASEMIARTIRNNIPITQIPITYNKRRGISKLNTWVDGGRHLRFLLLYAPASLVVIPGALSMLWSSYILLMLYAQAGLLDTPADISTFFTSSVLGLIGYQLILFGIFIKTYAVTHLAEQSASLDWIHRHLTFDKVVMVGIVAGLLACSIFIDAFGLAARAHIPTSYQHMLAATIGAISVQTILFAIMLSILGIREK